MVVSVKFTSSVLVVMLLEVEVNRTVVDWVRSTERVCVQVTVK